MFNPIGSEAEILGGEQLQNQNHILSLLVWIMTWMNLTLSNYQINTGAHSLCFFSHNVKWNIKATVYYGHYIMQYHSSYDITYAISWVGKTFCSMKYCMILFTAICFSYIFLSAITLKVPYKSSPTKLHVSSGYSGGACLGLLRIHK